MVRGVRLFLRGLSDTLENLLPFVLYSLTFWVCCFTIVLGPGAMVALFTATDPRAQSDIDRLSVREFLSVAVRRLGDGWKLALVTVPILAILVHNLWFYQDTGDDLEFLAPAWIILLFFGSLITMSAFSAMALFNENWKQGLRIGALVTGARMFQILAAGILLWILLAIGSRLVVPLFILLPATIAVTFNRHTLTTLNISVNDPLAPTDERRAEESFGKRRRWFGP